MYSLVLDLGLHEGGVLYERGSLHEEEVLLYQEEVDSYSSRLDDAVIVGVGVSVGVDVEGLLLKDL